MHRFSFLHESIRGGGERERKKNSGHLLFLAADRSILQSIKIELWHTCFAKCKNSNPHISTKKHCRKGYVFCSVFLSKSQTWYIIDARSAAYIISSFGAVYHHASACIPLRLDDIQNFVLMICNFLRN